MREYLTKIYPTVHYLLLPCVAFHLCHIKHPPQPALQKRITWNSAAKCISKKKKKKEYHMYFLRQRTEVCPDIRVCMPVSGYWSHIHNLWFSKPYIKASQAGTCLPLSVPCILPESAASHKITWCIFSGVSILHGNLKRIKWKCFHGKRVTLYYRIESNIHKMN